MKRLSLPDACTVVVECTDEVIICLWDTPCTRGVYRWIVYLYVIYVQYKHTVLSNVLPLSEICIQSISKWSMWAWIRSHCTEKSQMIRIGQVSSSLVYSMFESGHLTWPLTQFTFYYLRPNKDRLCPDVGTRDVCRLTLFVAIKVGTNTEQVDKGGHRNYLL